MKDGGLIRKPPRRTTASSLSKKGETFNRFVERCHSFHLQAVLSPPPPLFRPLKCKEELVFRLEKKKHQVAGLLGFLVYGILCYSRSQRMSLEQGVINCVTRNRQLHHETGVTER